jgi:hypothetical protein
MVQSAVAELIRMGSLRSAWASPLSPVDMAEEDSNTGFRRSADPVGQGCTRSWCMTRSGRSPRSEVSLLLVITVATDASWSNRSIRPRRY